MPGLKRDSGLTGSQTMAHKYNIDPSIEAAETLPAAFYRDAAVFDALREKVFQRCWHWLGDVQQIPLPGQVQPLVLLDQLLNEPLLLVRDESDRISCLSNVCTHRGNLVVQQPGKFKQLICQYHGRRFGLDGAFLSMPEFRDARDFPRPCDNLHRFPLEQWGSFLFAGLEPAFPFEQIARVLDERVGFLPLQQFRRRPDLSKDYLVHAHWALYCDNYLEGFHIPFVHPDLNATLDYGAYRTELFEHMNLQVGLAKGAEDCFDLPENHPDAGQQVAAYYFWIFPNLMLNFYPWGLSVNLVQPLSPARTKVSFITYVYDESKLHTGAGALLDKVEREDEFVVEGVQKGLQSRYYQAGRFSPRMEKGVHHFHRLLAAFLT